MSTKFCPSVHLSETILYGAKLKFACPCPLTPLHARKYGQVMKYATLSKKPERPVYIINLIHFMVLSALIQHTNSQTAYDLRWLWIGQIEEVDHQVVDFPTLENIRNVPQCCWCDMPSTSFENCKKVRYKVNGNVSYVSYKTMLALISGLIWGYLLDVVHFITSYTTCERFHYSNV